MKEKTINTKNYEITFFYNPIADISIIQYIYDKKNDKLYSYEETTGDLLDKVFKEIKKEKKEVLL